MRVARMGHAQRVTKKNKKGTITSSWFRVRVEVPPALRPLLPPPYTGKQNLTKKARTESEHAEWEALFLRMREDARALLFPPKPVNYVRVPLAPLTTHVISQTVVRGGFGSRMVREEEAPAILTAQGEAAAQSRAGAAQPLRDKPPTITAQTAPFVVPDGPVPFEAMVWDWVKEKKLPNRAGRMMLSKVNRLVMYLERDDMGRIGQDDLIGYKKHLLNAANERPRERWHP